jgi:hypothetical protein
MLQALTLAAGLAAIVVVMHLAGLAVLLTLIRRGNADDRPRHPALQAGFIVLIVLALFGVHALEIGVFALAYRGLGEIATLEAALYFSATSFSTLGYGDVVIAPPWRLIAAVEGLIGFLMIGWSTAFLVSVIGRLRALEADWFDRAASRE